MKSARARSRGIRNPVRNTVLLGLLTSASVALVLTGIADMRESGSSGSPLLALGLFPALLAPIALVHYARRIRTFRDLRGGRRAIARWTVPAAEFARFREADDRLAARPVTTSFNEPPRDIPAEGLEVIFSNDGVLIGDGYFPLSMSGGRRVRSVRYDGSDPPSIEFATVLTSSARTSRYTNTTVHTLGTLRVPVATNGRQQAEEVVRRFQAMIPAQ